MTLPLSTGLIRLQTAPAWPNVSMLSAAHRIATPHFCSHLVADTACLDSADVSPLSAMLCPGLAAIRLPCLAHPLSAMQAQRAVELPQLPAAAAPGPLPAQPQASARPAASGLTNLSGDTVSEAVSAPTSTATPGTGGGTAAAAQAAAARVGTLFSGCPLHLHMLSHFSRTQLTGLSEGHSCLAACKHVPRTQLARNALHAGWQAFTNGGHCPSVGPQLSTSLVASMCTRQLRSAIRLSPFLVACR